MTVLLASCLPQEEALPALAYAHAQARLIPEANLRAEALTHIADMLPPQHRIEVCREALAAVEAAVTSNAGNVDLMGQAARAASLQPSLSGPASGVRSSAALPRSAGSPSVREPRRRTG